MIGFDSFHLILVNGNIFVVLNKVSLKYLGCFLKKFFMTPIQGWFIAPVFVRRIVNDHCPGLIDNERFHFWLACG